jgi:hypothetical protein
LIRHLLSYLVRNYSFYFSSFLVVTVARIG